MEQSSVKGPSGRLLGTHTGGEFGDWAPPAIAWERVRAAWGPPSPTAAQDIPLNEARGRVLAGNTHAPLDSPAFDRSAMDGYAVRAADTVGATDDAPARLSYAGDVPMGAASAVHVAPGQAVWVATGSMIPDGADGVIMVERTAREGDTVLVRQAVAAGDNIVRRGADLRAGDLVLRAGHTLRPQDVAVLASMGVARIPVRARPRVAIVSGGDELVTPGEPLGPGQIYDSNSYAMAAQVAAWGGDPYILPRTPDRPEAVRDTLRRAIDEAGIVLLSGGSSVGVKDLTATAIDAAGAPGVVVHGVAMRPGRPTIIGVVDRVLVIGIPGNPVSAMVACEVFARPAIETLLGVVPARMPGTIGDYAAYGALTEPVRSQAGRQDYVRVALARSVDGAVAVTPVPGGSGVIRSMVDAGGLLVVPPERESFEQGETVEVRLF
jgi:molybdopterin molybdotransferase